MRDYKNENNPIRDAVHKIFEFDIYKINSFEEWKKIRTVKLIDYKKIFSCSGSGGCEIYNRKNGKKLDLLTFETYDYIMKNGDINYKQEFLKRNYITLETLNTIDLIAEKEDWIQHC